MPIRKSKSFTENVDIDNFLKCLSIVITKCNKSINTKGVIKKLHDNGIIAYSGGFDDKLSEYLWKFKQEDKIILDKELNMISLKYPNYVNLCNKLIAG